MTTWVASVEAPNRVSLVDVDGDEAPERISGDLATVVSMVIDRLAGMPVAVDAAGLGLSFSQELIVQGAKVVTFRMTDAR